MMTTMPTMVTAHGCLPEPAVVWKAIETYLRFAYGDRPIPAPVAGRLSTLHAAGGMAFYQSNVFEADGVLPGTSRHRLSLRLGNPWYPHMRLEIDACPDGTNVVFRADTHDRHISLPPGASESAAFDAMRRRNQKLADDIETAWVGQGVPTLKSYTTGDMARGEDSMNHFQPHLA